MTPVDFLVCIRCFTFNHAPYIEDAMNGFCMQDASFPFVCTIVDDASTDGEQEVIKAYLQKHFDIDDPSIARNEETDDYVLVFARHKTNKNCFFSVFFLKYNHYSRPKAKDRKFLYISRWYDYAKYIAFCEGDDCWIDPLKLQKQVDFLEIHPDFGLCYTNSCKLLNGKLLKSKTLSRGKCDFKSLLFHNDIATLTVICRKDILSDYDNSNFPSSKWLMGDYPKWLYISKNMRIHYLGLVAGVYRVLPESASHSKSIEKQLAFLKSTYDIRRFFANQYLIESEKSNILRVLDSNEMWGSFRIIMGHNKKEAYRFLLENRDKMTFQMYLKALLLIFKF